MSLAVNRRWKSADGEDKEETVFMDVQAWGKIAEIIGRHCTKGANLLFQGRLKLDQWEDKQTGQKRSKLYVVADSFQFAGRKPEGEDQGPVAERAPTRKPAPAAQPARSESQEDGTPLDENGDPLF
jgi:single-strand DNA-binding protein